MISEAAPNMAAAESPKDPYTGLHAEAIYAMWHDPLTYDPIKHGPPYLPEMKVKMASLPTTAQAGIEKEAKSLDQIWQNILASVGSAPMAELAILLAFLKAEAWVHQAHHWQTRGCSYYGDHLLFERLYDDAYGLVDGLAEKAVGTGNHMLVQPLIQGQCMLSILECLYKDAPVNPSAEEYVLLSLRAVLRFLAVERMAYESLESKGQLSHGIDNMLQGIADKHEEFAYLLKQRCKSKTAAKRNAMDHQAGNIRLTPKELARASGNYTIIVRPQASGGYLVAAVEIEGNTGKLVPVHQEIVEDQSGIARAVQEINRWLAKLGYPVEMAWMSRERQQWKPIYPPKSAAWKA